jgi:hypothetical protein
MLGAGATMVAQASGRSSSGVVDISGPCDEAEHANDPRCTGTGAGADDDNSGSGREDDEDSEDNSGPGGEEG